MGKKLDITDLDPGKIEMDQKWWPFKEEVLNMAKNLMGVDNNPLYYVISPDQPAVWVLPNAFEQRMYQLPHTGAVYNRDKKIEWGIILKAYMNTPLWGWIKEFEAIEDSKAAWKFLVGKCEVQDITNKQVLLATRIVSLSTNGGGTFNSNEYQFSF